MKIKLKDKDKPIKQNLCFANNGFCSTLLSEVNSGKEVEVERIPSGAMQFIEEVKEKKVKKVKKANKTKQGDK